eukprot:764907-Pelagomonas_calceolata.AAC.3
MRSPVGAGEEGGTVWPPTSPLPLPLGPHCTIDGREGQATRCICNFIVVFTIDGREGQATRCSLQVGQPPLREQIPCSAVVCCCVRAHVYVSACVMLLMFVRHGFLVALLPSIYT